MQIGIKLSACLLFRFICIHTVDLSHSPSTTAHPFVHAPHLDAPVAQFGGAARMWVKLLLRLLLLHHWQSYRKQKWRKEVEKKEVHCTERNSSEVYLALKVSSISWLKLTSAKRRSVHAACQKLGHSNSCLNFDLGIIISYWSPNKRSCFSRCKMCRGTQNNWEKLSQNETRKGLCKQAHTYTHAYPQRAVFMQKARNCC